jgi:hypothetical protein
VSKNLIFIEHKKDIGFFEDFFNKNSVIVSMHPSVSLELKERGIEHNNTLCLFNEKDHSDVLMHSTNILKIVRPVIDKGFDLEFNSTFVNTWVYYFKFYLHYLLSSIAIIRNAEHLYNPSHIVVIRPSFIVENKSRYGYIDQSLYSILNIYTKSRKSKVRYISKNTNLKVFSIVNYFKFHWIKNIIFEIMILLYPLLKKRGDSILTPDDTYGMSNFLDEISVNINNPFQVYILKGNAKISKILKNLLIRKSFSFIVISKFIPIKNKRKFMDMINIMNCNIKNYISKNHKKTLFLGIDIRPLLIFFVENNLKKEMLSVYGEVLSLSKILSTVRPKYVFSQHSVGMSYALGEYCSKESIPGLMIPHGSYTPHPGEDVDLEWSIHARTMINSKYPFVSVQTPLASKFLKLQKNVSSISINTGPLLLSGGCGKINENNIFVEHKNKFIILHASSPRDWYSFRPLIYETFDEYVRNLNNLIKIIEKIDGFYLAIRYRPFKEFSVEEFKKSLIFSNCYGVYSCGAFSDHLLESDLLISYSSTSIEESLLNKIPVLQYDPDNKYKHISDDIIRSDSKSFLPAVCSASSEDQVVSALRKYYNFYPNHKDLINWSKYFVQVNNSQWLKEFIKK